MIENTENQQKVDDKPQKRPDELGGVYFSSSIKIFDPETNEILVQKRGDN